MQKPLRAPSETAFAVSIYGGLLKIGEQRLETTTGEFTAHLFQNLSTRNAVIAVTLGDMQELQPLLCRVHSSCVTSELLGGRDCDCAEQLTGALEAIAARGRGALFYLMQEGRGAGLAAKARDRMLVQASDQRISTFDAYRQMGLNPDHRHYGEVAAACRLLGIAAPLELLTNNPDKASALRDANLAICGTKPLQAKPSPYNSHYLAAKQRAGHTLPPPMPDKGAAAVELPEPVETLHPQPLINAEHIIHIAAYLLPVTSHGSGSHWLRLHVYVDIRRGIELIVLSYNARQATPLIRIQQEHLLERFPLCQRPVQAGWQTSMRHFIEHGAGYAIFLPASLAPQSGSILNEDTVFRLIAHLLDHRAARPILDNGDCAFDRSVCAGLAAQGVVTLDPILLERDSNGYPNQYCKHRTPQKPFGRPGNDRQIDLL